MCMLVHVTRFGSKLVTYLSFLEEIVDNLEQVSFQSDPDPLDTLSHQVRLILHHLCTWKERVTIVDFLGLSSWTQIVPLRESYSNGKSETIHTLVEVLKTPFLEYVLPTFPKMCTTSKMK